MPPLRLPLAMLALVSSLGAQARAGSQVAPRPTPTPRPTSRPAGLDFAALSKKAHAARDAGRIEEAVTLYRQALAQNPAWAEGLWYLGTLLYEKDRFAEAREALRRLVALTPRAGAPWALLGLSEFRAKEYAPALEHLEKGRALGLGSNEALIQVARYHTAILLTRFKAFTNATDLLVGLARSQPEGDDLTLALGLNILRRPLLPTEVGPSERPVVARAGRAAYFQAVGRHQEARRAFELLRTESGAEPGIADMYREFLAAYPKALSDAAVREQALQELRNELEAAPSAFEANLYLGLLLRESSPAEAATCLEKAHAARPEAPEPAYELARLRFAEGQAERARDLLETAVARAPAFSEAHVLLASVYYRLNRRAEGDRERALARKGAAARNEPASATNAVAAAAPPGPGRFEALARQATAAREAERLDEAVKAYRQALALRSSWDEGLWYLGTILYDLERPAEARETFLRLVNLKPEGGAGWAYLGLCEFRQGEYDVALQHLERGRTLGLVGNESLLGTVRYYVAILLSRRGEFEMALQILSAFAVAGNQSPSVIEALGVATLRMPRLPTEVPEGLKAVVAAVGRAAFEHAARRFDEARRAYEELLRVYPAEPNLHYAYGVFLLGQDPARAMGAFQEEILLSPGHVFARLHMAFEYLKRADATAALPLAQEAVRLAPDNFAARNALGRALLEQGDVPGAIVQLEEGRRLAPDSPEMQFALARALAQAGRKEDADRARAEFRRLDDIRKAAQKSTIEETALRKPSPEPPQPDPPQ